MSKEVPLAWQRVVRVLGHEIRNSLTPIQSLSAMLAEGLDEGKLTPDELREGLALIERRALAIALLLDDCAQLAELSAPRRTQVDAATWVQRVGAAEQRLTVEIVPGPACSISVDPEQMDTLLSKLVRSAVDATGGGVSVGWTVRDGWLHVHVDDDGPGVADPSSLFVPFFPSPRGGLGIGLALARQIAESHGGYLALEPRADARGCRAHLSLPLA